MKSYSRRLLAIVTASAATAVVLTGCSPASGGGDAALDVQTNLAAGSSQLAVMTDIAKRFEAENAGVTLNLIPSSSTYEQDIKVKLAAKDAPDIWQTHGWSRDRYADFLAPLQDETWAADVNPLLDSAMRDDDGAIYAVPMVADVAGLVYNADVLSAAGVDPASLSDWDAFSTAAQQIVEAGKVPVEVSGKANGPAGNLIDWLAPGFYDEDQLAALKQGDFDAAAYQPILETISSWEKQGFINPDYSSATADDVSKALGSGEAAFVFSQNTATTNALITSPDANLAFMPVPSNNGEPYLIGGEGIAYGASKSGDQVDDAKKFLAFLAVKDNQEAFAKASGGAPGLTDAASDLGPLQPSYDTWVVEQATPLVPYFDRVWLPNGLWNTLVTTTDSVLTGQATPEAATAQVGTDFAGLYGQGE